MRNQQNCYAYVKPRCGKYFFFLVVFMWTDNEMSMISAMTSQAIKMELSGSKAKQIQQQESNCWVIH